MKKIIQGSFLIAVLFPSLTFAAWWNPMTWSIFKKKESVSVIQPIHAPQPIIEVKKEITVTHPTVKQKIVPKPVVQEVPVVIPVNTIITEKKPDPTPPVSADVCPEIEGLQTIVPLGYIKYGNGPCEVVKVEMVTPNATVQAQNTPVVNNNDLEEEYLAKKQIYDLNIKYVNDIKNCESHGGIRQIADACMQQVTRDYQYMLILLRQPTAVCNDGTVSYSQNHSGTCSSHGGVYSWY